MHLHVGGLGGGVPVYKKDRDSGEERSCHYHLERVML